MREEERWPSYFRFVNRSSFLWRNYSVLWWCCSVYLHTDRSGLSFWCARHAPDPLSVCHCVSTRVFISGLCARFLALVLSCSEEVGIVFTFSHLIFFPQFLIYPIQLCFSSLIFLLRSFPVLPCTWSEAACRCSVWILPLGPICCRPVFISSCIWVRAAVSDLRFLQQVASRFFLPCQLLLTGRLTWHLDIVFRSFGGLTLWVLGARFICHFACKIDSFVGFVVEPSNLRIEFFLIFLVFMVVFWSCIRVVR
jgi:hypothetical protein